MCNCIYNTEVRDRCLPNRNMQNFKDCNMRVETACWLFEKNISYREIYVAKTYKQMSVILRKFIDKVLKLRSLCYKRDIISHYIYQVHGENVDNFINELLNERPTIITREWFEKYLKKHSLYRRIKQVIKYDLLSIEYHIEDIWDNNKDLFAPDEDSDDEDEDEDKEESNLIKTKCGCKIIKDSKKHDLCVCDDNGENWVCADCYSDKD